MITIQILDKNLNVILKVRVPVPGEGEEPFSLKKLIGREFNVHEILNQPFGYYSAETNMWINNENGGFLELIWLYISDLINGDFLKIRLLNYAIKVDPQIKKIITPKMTIRDLVYKVAGFVMYQERLSALINERPEIFNSIPSLNKTIKWIYHQSLNSDSAKPDSNKLTCVLIEYN